MALTNMNDIFDKLKIYIDHYVKELIQSLCAMEFRQDYIAIEGQLVFTTIRQPENVIVTLNGAVLTEHTDYSLGSLQVIMVAPCTAGDEVSVIW
jgi:hypothetical protein